MIELNRTTKWQRIALAALLVLSAPFALADTPKEAHVPPVPLLWKVSDQDNSVYLLGSFHLLRPDDYPLSADVQSAFEDAESLMFEVPPGDMDSPTVSRMMMQAALRRDGTTLESDVDAATWTQLQAWTSKNGVPLANLASFKPWFASLTISITEMMAQGLDPKLGLDAHFMQQAQAVGKPTAGLEQIADQVLLLSGMDAVEQRQLLKEALEEAAKGSAQTEKMHRAWRSGDARFLLEEMATKLKREFPRLYQRINVDRNDAWLPKIQQRLDASGTDDTLIIVGALHLLGNDGVVEKLRTRGYQVERICGACTVK